MVVNINVNYRRAVGPGERLQVVTSLQKLGNRSGVLKQEIRFKDSQEIAADALVTFVITGPDGSAVTIEGEVKEDLQKIGSGTARRHAGNGLCQHFFASWVLSVESGMELLARMNPDFKYIGLEIPDHALAIGRDKLDSDLAAGINPLFS